MSFSLLLGHGLLPRDWPQALHPIHLSPTSWTLSCSGLRTSFISRASGPLPLLPRPVAALWPGSSPHTASGMVCPEPGREGRGHVYRSFPASPPPFYILEVQAGSVNMKHPRCDFFWGLPAGLYPFLTSHPQLHHIPGTEVTARDLSPSSVSPHSLPPPPMAHSTQLRVSARSDSASNRKKALSLSMFTKRPSLACKVQLTPSSSGMGSQERELGLLPDPRLRNGCEVVVLGL